MSEPRNHHYVPQWLLRAWCSPSDSKLQSFFRLEDGRLSSQRKAPKSVASQRDLYSWVAPLHNDPTELERGFFQELDAKAARAAHILREPGTVPMPMEMRRDWARFLMATLARTPLGLEGWRYELRKMGRERLGERHGLVDSLMPGWLKDTALEQIIELLSGDRAIEFCMDMRWWVERTDGARYSLLTSDHPCVGRLVEDTGHRLLMYPLSPMRLFCATDDPLMAYYISTGGPDLGVNWSNNLQIKEARRHLFAVDESLVWHIEKYFGEGFPEPPLPETNSGNG